LIATALLRTTIFPGVALGIGASAIRKALSLPSIHAAWFDIVFVIVMLLIETKSFTVLKGDNDFVY
jgi:hypothetical protein